MDEETLDDLLSTEPTARVPGGQSAEFRVWAEVIDQSAGALHVFLPLLDHGIDGVLHNLRTGAYTPVQVKSRSVVFHQSVVTLTIYEDRLVDDDAILIAVLRRDQGLGPMVLVVKEGRFRKLATRSTFRGRSILSAYFSMHPTSRSRWGPDLIPLEQLGERLLSGRPTAAPEHVARQTPAQARQDPWRGFLGEVEVIRHLATVPELELYRPFPDYEVVDLLLRHHATRRFLALQVKTVTCPPVRRTLVDLGEPPFPAAQDLWLIVLAWQPQAAAFHPECLLIPSQRLDEVALLDTGKLVIQWRPGGRTAARVDPFRHPLDGLAALVSHRVRPVT